jgi:hypothetical protein
MEIAPRPQAGFPFQWKKVRDKRALSRNRLGNLAEQLRRADRKKKTGSGVVSIRTREGCSILESEQGRRLPASYGSED